MPNDTTNAPPPPSASEPFDAEAWTKELFDLNPWAKPFWIDGQLINIDIRENDPIPEQGMDSLRRTFKEARREACVERWRHTLSRLTERLESEDGSHLWNDWAEEMENKRQALIAAHAWTSRPLFSFGKVQNAVSLLWCQLADVDFSDLHFLGPSVFSHFTFPHNSNFTGTHFGAPEGSNIQIQGGALFYFARFQGGHASFIEARFNGDAMFSDAQFNGGNADFSAARFNGESAYFNNSQFNGGDADFSLARFNGSVAWFGDAKFNGGDAVFEGARFNGSVGYFANSYCSKDMILIDSRFNRSDVDFLDAKLDGDMLLADANVDKHLIFDGLNVSGNIDASRMKVKGPANVRRAIFSGFANFSSMQSSVSASFNNSHFHQVPDFSDAVFHEPPRLDNMTIGDPLGPSSHPDRSHISSVLSSWISGIAIKISDDIKAQTEDDVSKSTPPIQATLLKRLSELRWAFRNNKKFSAWISERAENLASELADADMWIELPDGGDLRPAPARLSRWIRIEVGRRLQPLWVRWIAIARDPDAAAKFRKLKKMAMQAEDRDRELEFHAQEIRCRRFWEDYPSWHGRGMARFWLGLAYEVFSDFGRSFARPAIALVTQWFLFTMLFMSSWSRDAPTAPPTTDATPSISAWSGFLEANVPAKIAAALGWMLSFFQAGGERLWSFFSGVLPIGACHQPADGWAFSYAAYLSLKNTLVLIRPESPERIYKCLFGVDAAGETLVPNSFFFLSSFQIGISAILFFLLLLAVRNMLKLD